MTIRDIERTVTYEEKWITGGDVRELRRAVEDFAHDNKGLDQPVVSWRVQGDYLVLSARLMESQAGE